MPRNVEENVYITVGFARDSWTWQRLQSEARDLDISIPHLIKILLADRAAALDGHGKHLWFPRSVTSPEKQPVAPLADPDSAMEDGASIRQTAAAAAAHYWND